MARLRQNLISCGRNVAGITSGLEDILMSSLTESCNVSLNRVDARRAVDAFGEDISAIVDCPK